MNHQIIENAPFREYFQVHILLWRAVERKVKGLRYSFSNADTIRHFSYSVSDNHYHTLRQLNRQLNEFPGLVVTNDGLELEACRKFGTRSVLFSIVHDFYNLRLAIESQDLVDYFICHTEVFTRALLSSHSLKGRVEFLLHGVRIPETPAPTGTKAHERLKIISISRLTESKGVLLLAGIDEQLLQRGVHVDWVIIGSGELEEELKAQWAGKGSIQFYNPDGPEGVIAIARDCDIFISPSHFEGYGIALLEAMSCGLVPVIHRLPVGVYSDLPEDTGFSVEIGDAAGFADRIERLHRDRALLAAMGRRARLLVAEKYDITKTAGLFLQHFATHGSPQINKDSRPKQNQEFGVLDRPYIPNSLARFVRKFRS